MILSSCTLTKINYKLASGGLGNADSSLPATSGARVSPVSIDMILITIISISGTVLSQGSENTVIERGTLGTLDPSFPGLSLSSPTITDAMPTAHNFTSGKSSGLRRSSAKTVGNIRSGLRLLIIVCNGWSCV